VTGLPTVWGSTITVKASSASPDADPVWVDLSDYVTFREGDLQTDTGQQTDLDETAEPSVARLAWRNDNHEFTDSAGLFPWFKEARRVRVEETIGAQTFCLFDGYLGPPTQVPLVDTSAAPPVAFLTTAATAADRLSRLRNSRAFISTLTEYVRNAGRATLQSYWPLLDPAGSSTFTNVVGDAAPMSAAGVSVEPALTTALFTESEFITPAVGPVAFTDDRSPVQFAVDLGTSGGVLNATRWRTLKGSPSITCNTNTVTLVFWVYPDVTRSLVPAGFSPCGLTNFNTQHTAGTQADIELFCDSTGTTWTADFYVNGAFVDLTPPALRTNAWNLVSLSMTLPSGDCTAYVHNMGSVSGNIAGAPASATFTQIFAGARTEGSVSHVQVYLGPYTQATHDAQLAAALTGLQRQTTGERVNTILDYANVPAAIRDVDPGVAVMSTASLAGKDPLTLLEEARRTERGRLFMADGRLKFHDRRRVFNV